VSPSPSPDPEEPAGPALLEVGRIVKAQGIRGEVVVEAITTRPERFAAGATLVAGGPDGRRFAVLRSTRHKAADSTGRPQHARWIVAFEGFETRSEAEVLRGTVLYGERIEADDPDDNELWVHDLVGSEVVDTAGTVLGRVEALQANPASDLLVLETGGLIPLVFIVESSGGRVVVDPPVGLLDL
jgi:16S rRNA processing protein RimM